MSGEPSDLVTETLGRDDRDLTGEFYDYKMSVGSLFNKKRTFYWVANFSNDFQVKFMDSLHFSKALSRVKFDILKIQLLTSELSKPYLTLSRTWSFFSFGYQVIE